MLIMKAIFLLMGCSIINILGVNSQCVPAELIGFDPAQLAGGTWYLNKLSPNLFTQLTNVIEYIQYDGEKFTGNLTVTFNGRDPEVHDEILYVQGNVLDCHLDGLSQFNAQYEILATDYNTYYLKKGNASATSPDALRIVFTKDKCPSSATVAAIDQAIEDQCWNVNDFQVDPSISAACPASG